jgi:hypothetical protein
MKALFLKRSISKEQGKFKAKQTPPETFEQRQEPNTTPRSQWSDAFTFHGFSDKKTGTRIITRLAFRKGRTEGWVFLSLPNIGTLTFDSQTLIAKSSSNSCFT